MAVMDVSLAYNLHGPMHSLQPTELSGSWTNLRDFHSRGDEDTDSCPSEYCTLTKREEMKRWEVTLCLSACLN